MGPFKRLAFNALLAYLVRMFSGDMAYDKVLGNVRHLLTLAGGYLIAEGHLEPEAWETISGALLSIVGFVWSMLVKRK